MISSSINITDIIDPFGGVPSPVECWKLNLVALFVTILLFLSISANTTLLWAFYTTKELRTPLNVFVIAMTVINLFGSISEFTYIIASNFACKWVFGKAGCYSSGFVMYTIGMMQIYLMAAISFERYYIIYKPMAIKNVNFKTTTTGVFICFLAALFWSFLPLVGWSHYSLEGALTSCSVEWAERTFNVVSYNFCLFIFGFVFPMGLIIYCNVQLMKIIKAMPNMAKDDEKAKKRIENERQLSIVMMIYIAGFAITWTPYAFVSMVSAFIDPELISPFGTLIPALFAKTSMVWSTIFYILSNKQIKYKVFRSAAESKSEETGTVSKQDDSRV